jgi:hypothetical protein
MTTAVVQMVLPIGLFEPSVRSYFAGLRFRAATHSGSPLRSGF